VTIFFVSYNLSAASFASCAIADLWDDLLEEIQVELVCLLWDTLGRATPSARVKSWGRNETHSPALAEKEMD
jgi:hypothetical protein